MILFIISAIIGALASSILYFKNAKFYLKKFHLISNTLEIAFYGAMLGCLMGLVLFGLLSLICVNIEKKEIVTEQKIYTVENSNETSSDLFLVKDYTDNKITYRYVIDTGNAKQIKEIDCTDQWGDFVDTKVFIHEGNYEPSVKIQKWGDFKKAWYNYFISNLQKGEVKRADFYVPKGAVSINFNNNL